MDLGKNYSAFRGIAPVALSLQGLMVNTALSVFKTLRLYKFIYISIIISIDTI